MPSMNRHPLLGRPAASAPAAVAPPLVSLLSFIRFDTCLNVFVHSSIKWDKLSRLPPEPATFIGVMNIGCGLVRRASFEKFFLVVM